MSSLESEMFFAYQNADRIMTGPIEFLELEINRTFETNSTLRKPNIEQNLNLNKPKVAVGIVKVKVN